MRQYPKLVSTDSEQIKAWADNVTRQRISDVDEMNALPNVYIAGRKVAKVPTSSSDITGSFPGDFNVTVSFAYFCINNAGTVEWVRVAVGTF